VRVLGSNVATDTLAVRSQVGFMPEAACLPQDQTAADFIGYTAELAGIPHKAARQRSSDILGLVGLAEERFRPMGEFSTGMAQRAKMAQALVHGPDLLLLDEPTAGLDPEGRDEMLDLITRIGDFGINVIVSSHVLGDIERTCEWIIMLDGGRVLRQGPIEGLSDQGIAEVEILGEPDAVIAALQAAGAEVRREGRRIAVDHPEDPFIVVRDAVATTGATIRSLGARTTSLEDIFLGEEVP
jgi:ABC-2 type transport system ATP-binding protein